jgi:miniconductance mechanosensitive channel
MLSGEKNMTPSELSIWFENHPVYTILILVLLSVVVLIIARLVIGRGLTYLAGRTRNTYDDILVRGLHPFRAAWLAPMILIYTTASLLPDYQIYIEKFALFAILWLSAATINSMLDAINQIYEAMPQFSGVSIQGYLDIVKIIIFLVGIILSISLFTDKSPLVLLAGMGAIMAILLLIFRDTILALVASVQITTNDLIKEGDWLEVPGFEADGDVININLHTIKIKNFDNTITVIPTYKIVEEAYKNWRGMKEAGGRRIKRSLQIDLQSIQFCDRESLVRLGKIDLVHDYVQDQIKLLEQFQNDKGSLIDSPLDGPQVTNLSVFRKYIESYLNSHPALHHENMDLLVRELTPNQTGLPVEIYGFTRTTDWMAYESIQADIIDHLLAAAPYFDLRVFQDPTGTDFSKLVPTP